MARKFFNNDLSKNFNNRSGGRILPALTCYQLNAQHKRVATSNLINLIEQFNADLIFLQEPYCLNNELAGVPKQYKIHSMGTGRKRAATLINNKTIDSVLITQLSNEDCVLVEINYGSLKFFAANIYLDYGDDIENGLNVITSITQYVKTEKLLITVDSNSRSAMWHDIMTNARGKKLEEFIVASSLFIINEDNYGFTFESSRGKSKIDITLSSSNFCSYLTEWKSGMEESCSDHKLIQFEISKQKKDEATFNHHAVKYNTKKGSFESFECNLKKNFSKSFNCTKVVQEAIDEELAGIASNEPDFDSFLEKFYEAVKWACEDSFPLMDSNRNKVLKKSVPWWNDNLTILRKKVNALRRRYQKTTDSNLREERRSIYFEQKKEYEGLIRKSKFDSWKECCNAANEVNPWNVVYKAAARKTRLNTAFTTLKKPNGNFTTTIKDTLEHMMENFVPTDDIQIEGINHKQTKLNSVDPPTTQNDKEFTQEEIRSVIQGMNPKKATGEDGLTSEIILVIYKNYPLLFKQIYNECLKRGCFPKRWKTSVIIPIVKPGKENSDDANKFRPISLINIGGKILEKLLINRIMHHIYSHNLLNKNQFGFIPQRSTTDAAMFVREHIEKLLQGKKSVIVTSLDVKGAFNAAWWPAILNSLKQFNCPKNLYILTMNYFKDRKATLQLNSIKIEQSVTMGCPQGSCCGPGLWNIQYNSLLNVNYTQKTKVIAFADDLLVMTHGTNLKEAENYANLDLKKIENWAKNNKLIFNDQKSMTMLITRKIRNEGEINIYLNGNSLNQVSEIKYLGIYFDDRLNFNSHVKHTTEKAIKLIHTLSRSAKMHWGLGHEALKTIYTGAIQPILSYGVPVWIKAAGKKANQAMLRRVQRLINIKIAKACRTLSYEASCILSGVTPIIIKIEEINRIYLATRSGGDESYDSPVAVSDWIHPAEIPVIKQPGKNLTPDIEIYTDGSKTGDKVGSGVAIYRNNQLEHDLQYRLNAKCSNNQAEQMAILKGLEKLVKISKSDRNPLTVVLYTDSRVAIDSLKATHNHGKIISNIRTLLTSLERKFEIYISWVKAHEGNEGNERADYLAKSGAACEQEEEIYTKIPRSEITREAKRESVEKWESEWNSSVKGKVTKEFFPTVSVRLKHKFKVNSNITVLMTGHGKLRSYLHRFHILDSARCPCDADNQTVDHLIYQCDMLKVPRRTLINSIIIKGGDWPVDKELFIKHYFGDFNLFVKSIIWDKM